MKNIMKGETGYKIEAEQLVNKIDEFSSNKLKNKEDLTRIIQFAFQSQKEQLLKDTSFTAKYVQGLIRIIQAGKTDIEEDYFTKVKKELSENLEKIKLNLNSIIGEENSFIKNIFDEKYFNLTQTALDNLTGLCNDLSWLKMYLNEYKNF